MEYIFLITGIILGFVFWNIFAGKHEGDRPERSVRFMMGKYIVHIHHWLWCVVLIGLLFFFDMKSLLGYGFLVGSILQGFTYKDFLWVVYEEERHRRFCENLLNS